MTTITIGDNATLQLRYANRHGLVTGATGTGKTVTLQKMADGFSAAGVPVFAADIKGDLSGIAEPHDGNASFPTRIWDLFGQSGIHLRATLHDIGPMILSRMLGLNETQEGVLTIAFKMADFHKSPIMTIDDLRALLDECMDKAATIRMKWGNITPASIGAIQRGLLILEGQGGQAFFGEPAINFADFINLAPDGRGYVNLLSADKLMANPRLYAGFLLWFLTRLYEQLPEVGDCAKPKMVFFFDEAHILFTDAPKSLLEAIERTVRLIRSKGIGVYFVTQNPRDIPDSVLAQLGTRVQHALRAFTPREQKAIKAAAETFRANPELDTATVIQNLGVGEALFSTLGDGGVPTMVQRVKIDKPTAQIGPLTGTQRRMMVEGDPMNLRYSDAGSIENQHMMLMKRVRPEWLWRPESKKRAEEAIKAKPTGAIERLFRWLAS